MTEPTELLACPFCGSKATASVNKGESLWSHDVVDWTQVHCTNDDCNAQTEATCEGYEPSAVEVWNTRTPQPTQAQVGVVPLTDEQIKEVMDLVSDWGTQSHLRGEAELDAHNPEATEDEITYAKECAEKERAAWNAIKDKLKPNGIKGGQHG